MRMPVGKFKGGEIAELPDSYIQWLVDSVDLYGKLQTAVQREYARRFNASSKKPKSTAVSTTQTVLIDYNDSNLLLTVVNHGYKATAKEVHPDIGGDPQIMLRLNALVESLRGQLS